MLTVANVSGGEGESAGAARSLLDEIARDGARRMLAAALEAEAAAYIEAHRGELDEEGHRLVVRNGYHQPRQVTTSAGALEIRAP
ncbi:MAG: transposase, partial [Actinomycetota bacterium]|nr:transposase [Actinomycetota bacterium]